MPRIVIIHKVLRNLERIVSSKAKTGPLSGNSDCFFTIYEGFLHTIDEVLILFSGAFILRSLPWLSRDNLTSLGDVREEK